MALHMALVLLILPVLASVGTAQDYGRIDTVRYWNGSASIDYLQAYHDTILVRIGEVDLPNDRIEISYDAGRSWQYVTDKRRVVDPIPGRGSYAVGYDRISPEGTGDSPQQFWVVRRGRVVFQDTIGYGHKEYPWTIHAMVVYPTDPQTIFYTGITSPVSGVINVIYVSTDDGRQWRLLNIPPPSEGIGFQIEIRFDFSDPSVWYFGVKGDDLFLGGRKQEWYSTADSGRTYTRLPSIGWRNGLLGNGTYMTNWYNSRTNSNENPVVTQRETGQSDTLPWLQNIQGSLFPDSDTTRAIVYTTSTLEDRYSRFHPDLPGLFIVRLRVDSLRGSQVTSWDGIVATSDTGRTWVWVLRPVRYMSLSETSIDPKNGIVYLSINATNDPTEDNRTYMLLKITPWAVSVKGENHDRSTVRVWPNPASDIVHVDTGPLTADASIDIVDMFGRGAGTGVVVQPQSANGSITIDVRSIPAGRYIIRINQHGTVVSVPIVVIH